MSANPNQLPSANARAAARVLCQALCDCGQWFTPTPLVAHLPQCKYRITVEDHLKRNRPQ